MKLNGYRVSHRNRWLLLKIISPSELLLFEYLIDKASFDSNKELYGVSQIQVSRIAQLFHYKSVNSIYAKLKKLKKIGLISLPSRGWQHTSITNFDRYLLSTNLQKGNAKEYAKGEKGQPVDAILHYIGVSSQYIENNSQPVDHKSPQNQTRIPSKGLSSFKVDSNSFDSPNDKSRFKDSNRKESGSCLPQDDKDWINENIS